MKIDDKIPLGRWYKLVGREAVRLEGFPGPGEGIDAPNRQIALTRTAVSTISTVFLSLDHNHFREGPPHIFETMVFERQVQALGDKQQKLDFQHDYGLLARYSTWDEAEKGHAKICDRIKEAEATSIRMMSPKLRKVLIEAQQEAELENQSD
ncbi:hypothetical protein [Mesorhizobium sp. SP-1A]|uniref:hypothetical protein n=1 Tax=Mesorhizobium sp. SP-1A TaxID=3077840 RepID=UPI0028F7334C|nr:hypothetical protein [Mesorhizobium sp. SP-1A]